jgi:hypothetical protein
MQVLLSRVRSLPSCILENNAGDSLLLNGANGESLFILSERSPSAFFANLL